MRHRFNDEIFNGEDLYQGLENASSGRINDDDSAGFIPDGHHGYDSTGKIRLTMDEKAAPLQVGLQGDWRSIVSVEGLPSAVVEAYQNAEHTRLESGATPLPKTGKFPQNESDAKTERDVDVPTDATAVLALLDKVENQIDQSHQILASPGTLAAKAGSPDNKLIATFDRGKITQVTLEEAWAEKASDRELSRSILTAIQEARNSAPYDSPLDGDIVHELRAMTADPEELLRRLGLKN